MIKASGGRWSRRSVSRGGFFPGEEGFSLLELALVIIIIGIMLSAAVVAYIQTTKRTDVKGAGEMVKQDVRDVFALADSAVLTNGERDQYRMVFHNGGEVPPSVFKVQKRTWLGAAWDIWTDEPVEKGEYNKIVSGVWIQPVSNSADAQISYLFEDTDGGTTNHLTFVSRGSVTIVSPDVDTRAGPPMKIEIISASTGKKAVITVSEYGNISTSN